MPSTWTCHPRAWTRAKAWPLLERCCPRCALSFARGAGAGCCPWRVCGWPIAFAARCRRCRCGKAGSSFARSDTLCTSEAGEIQPEGHREPSQSRDSPGSPGFFFWRRAWESNPASPFRSLGALAVRCLCRMAHSPKMVAGSEGIEPLCFHIPRFSRPIADRSAALPIWSSWRDSNSLRPILQIGAYPLQLQLHVGRAAWIRTKTLTGFEPASSAVGIRPHIGGR